MWLCLLPVDFRSSDPAEAEGARRRRPLVGYREPQCVERQLHTALRDQITTIVKNAVFNNFIPGRRFHRSDPGALASADGTRRITGRGPEPEAVGRHRDSEVHRHCFHPGQGFRPDLGSSDLTIQRQCVLGQIGVGCRQILDPGDIHPEAVRYPDRGSRQSCGCQHGPGECPTQSLQVKQQLGVQALAIANKSPETILSLFR